MSPHQPWLFHPDGSLPPEGGVFVFGSNLAGRHGAGAAKAALAYGAVYGQGIGRHGNSYAIPTKDGRPGTPCLSHPDSVLPLSVIRQHVNEFIAHAVAHPNDLFFITRIGCGLAGYADSQIAPLFASAPSNCLFAQNWERYLRRQLETPKG